MGRGRGQGRTGGLQEPHQGLEALNRGGPPSPPRPEAVFGASRGPGGCLEGPRACQTPRVSSSHGRQKGAQHSRNTSTPFAGPQSLPWPCHTWRVPWLLAPRPSATSPPATAPPRPPRPPSTIWPGSPATSPSSPPRSRTPGTRTRRTCWRTCPASPPRRPSRRSRRRASPSTRRWPASTSRSCRWSRS